MVMHELAESGRDRRGRARHSDLLAKACTLRRTASPVNRENISHT
jgi:hypothetical protein